MEITDGTTTTFTVTNGLKQTLQYGNDEKLLPTDPMANRV